MTLHPLTPAPGSAPARRARVAVAGVVLAGSLLGATLLSACGDDDAGTAAGGTASTTIVGSTTTGAPAVPGGLRPVVVEASDYAFDGLPEQVPAGTRLELRNDSEVELHELVAIRIPDDETRPVAELVHDPAALASLMPATVLLAVPGGEEIQAVGDGTLTEPGRYALICSIPTGISPAAYLEAVAAAGGGKPQLPGAAEPHLAHGMFAELVVE